MTKPIVLTIEEIQRMIRPDCLCIDGSAPVTRSIFDMDEAEILEEAEYEASLLKNRELQVA